MNLSYHQYIPQDFQSSSRVWIYQSSRLFSRDELNELKPIFEAFATNWKSHGSPVKGFAGLLFGQFIIIMADETVTGVGGCSTDSSVHVIQQIEEQFNVRLFDRQTLAFVINDTIQLLHLSQLKHAVENNLINADTLYFNNLVSTKEALLNQWLVPVRESWLAGRLKAAAVSG